MKKPVRIKMPQIMIGQPLLPKHNDINLNFYKTMNITQNCLRVVKNKTYYPISVEKTKLGNRHIDIQNRRKILTSSTSTKASANALQQRKLHGHHYSSSFSRPTIFTPPEAATRQLMSRHDRRQRLLSGLDEHKQEMFYSNQS